MKVNARQKICFAVHLNFLTMRERERERELFYKFWCLGWNFMMKWSDGWLYNIIISPVINTQLNSSTSQSRQKISPHHYQEGSLWLWLDLILIPRPVLLLPCRFRVFCECVSEWGYEVQTSSCLYSPLAGLLDTQFWTNLGKAGRA